jgi:hypothetical protein
MGQPYTSSNNAFKNRLDEAMQEHVFSLKMPKNYGPDNKSSSYLYQSSVKERSGSKGRIPSESSHEKFKNRQQAMGLFSSVPTLLFYKNNDLELRPLSSDTVGLIQVMVGCG